MISGCYKQKRSILLTVLLLLTAVVATAAGKFTLVIDAGHGGHDAGAKGQFSYEKNINLSVALAFGRYVEKNCPDVKVIYTRKTDVFIPLHTRADIANKNHADVFISIHTNALPAGRIARGLETYTMGMRRSNEKLSAAKRENSVITYESDYKQRYAGYDPNSVESAIMFEFIHDTNMAKSVELARLVQKNVCSMASRPDKGVKQDVFLVLRETSMPACLIELGFITTPDEERLLNDANQVDIMARGIYNAFAKYKNDNYQGFVVPYESKAKMEDPAPAAANDVKLPQEQSVATPVQECRDTADASAKQADKPLKTRAVRQTTTRTAQPAATGLAQPVKTRPAQSDRAAQNAPASGKVSATAAVSDGYVFKVQILASSTKLSTNSQLLKGEHEVSCYEEGGMYKYTMGSSASFGEMNRLRASLAQKFPGCFVVAFKDGRKVDVREASRALKNRK